MKEKLLRDIEISLSMNLDKEDREKAMYCIISTMRDYDVVPIVTDLTVRYETLNEDILKRYAACLKIDGMADSTIKQYLRTLKKLEEAVRKPFVKMTTDDLRYFLGSFKMRGLKNSSVENQRANVSAFFAWMVAEELIVKSPCLKIKTIKVEKEIKLPFSPVEIDNLRSTCRRQIDRAIIELLLSSGIRCNELCNLKISDIDLDKRVVNVKGGKGGKDRITYMSDIAAEHIRKYLNRHKVIGPYLFKPNSKHDKFCVRSIEEIINRTSKRAEVEDAHPHRFRRTFATNLYKRGMDIHEIQRLMGHSNVQTTLGYIYTDDEQIRAAYSKYAA